MQLRNRRRQSVRRAACWLMQLCAMRREYLHGYDNGREQVGNGHRNPHERTCTLLILHRRPIEELRRRQIRRVHNPAAEYKKCGKNVARQGREKKIQRHGPTRPVARTRHGLDDGPPKQESRQHKRRVFRVMPRVGPHGQLEHGGKMPSDHGCGREDPTKHRMLEKAQESLAGRAAKD